MLNCLAAASIAASASVASTSPSHLALAQRNRSSNVTVTVLTHPETPAQRPHRLAGAPGFEPGNGGIKISLIIQRFQRAFGKIGQNTL
jgi:hypothetical protein